MSIELHCPQCGKLIRAPDEAGGRKGKCPSCQRLLYIPTPATDDDVIAIVPIDPEEEAREAALRREAMEYAATLARASDRGSSGRGGASGTGKSAPRSEPVGEAVDVGKEVIAFIKAMRDSKLTEAEQVVTRLNRAGDRAKDHIEGLTLDEIPLQVEDVPPPLVQGFLKTLIGRLQ